MKRDYGKVLNVQLGQMAQSMYAPSSAEEAQAYSEKLAHDHISCTAELTDTKKAQIQFDVPTDQLMTTVLDGFYIGGGSGHRPAILIEVVQGDITKERTDAIASSTTQFLEFKSGVSAALVDKGGDQIIREADEILQQRKQIPTGSVAVTAAGDLAAKNLIHVVGPNNQPCQRGLDKDQLLAFAAAKTINKADQLGAESLSMPAVFCGHYAFNRNKCAKILLK